MKRLWHELFYTGKRQKARPAGQSLLRLLLPSCIAMVLSAACLAATSWAWFAGGSSAGVGTIQAASATLRSVSAVKTVKTLTTYAYAPAPSGEESGESAQAAQAAEGTETLSQDAAALPAPVQTVEEVPVPVLPADRRTASFQAEAGRVYHLTVDWGGTAANSFCLLSTPDGTYALTGSLCGREVSLCCAGAGTVTVTVCWGSDFGSAAPAAEGELLGSGTEIIDQATQLVAAPPVQQQEDPAEESPAGEDSAEEEPAEEDPAGETPAEESGDEAA